MFGSRKYMDTTRSGVFGALGTPNPQDTRAVAKPGRIGGKFPIMETHLRTST